MQTIEKKIKKIMVWLILIVVLGTILIEYAFNITFFRQLILLPLSLIAVSIFIYFYFRPNFIIRKRKEILLLLISLIIFFIIAEILLRATDCGWKWNITPDEDIKYKYESSAKICNSIIDGKKFHRTTNSDGFIDDEFEFNKTDYNIFLIGDSFAACLESDYNNCVHQNLEKNLKEIYGEEINIMNFGVSSYSGLAELAVIKKYVPEYKPKMIIFYFFVNDFKENQDYENKVYMKTKTQKIIRAVTPQTFLFFFTNGKNLMDKIFLKTEWYRDLSRLETEAISGHAMYANNYSEEWKNLIQKELEILDEVKNISLENNITLLIVATTAPEQVYNEKWIQAYETYPSLKLENYNSSKPNSIIMNYAGKNNISHLDLLPLFRENPDYLHWNEGHWNDEGQLFAEEKIKEYIIKNNLIKI